MSRPTVFPYGITLQEGGIVETFPIVEVGFLSPKGERTSLFLLLDSGAMFSALPKSDAAYFGVKLTRGSHMYVSGISGKPVKGWRHELSVHLAGEGFVIPVVFLNENTAPRVLGRAGVFDAFTIIFEERRNRSVFLRNDSEETHALQVLLRSPKEKAPNGDKTS